MLSGLELRQSRARSWRLSNFLKIQELILLLLLFILVILVAALVVVFNPVPHATLHLFSTHDQMVTPSCKRTVP